ncbi:hypothetical protein ACOME3_008830 [Neoechinorhynchus agilis]
MSNMKLYTRAAAKIVQPNMRDRRNKDSAKGSQNIDMSGASIAGILKRKNKQETKSGIYNIPCAECSSVYIGQTMQGIKKRISQDKQACKTFDKSSAISNHQQTIQHNVEFGKAANLPANRI